MNELDNNKLRVVSCRRPSHDAAESRRPDSDAGMLLSPPDASMIGDRYDGGGDCCLGATNKSSKNNEIGPDLSTDMIIDTTSFSLASRTTSVCNGKETVPGQTHQSEDANKSSEEGEAQLSSSSTSDANQCRTAVVTATATTSSGGDERDSSGGNGSGAGSTSESNGNAGKAHPVWRTEVRTSHHRRHDEMSASAGKHARLPAPVAERIQMGEHNTAHTKVIAHLSPHNADSNSSEGTDSDKVAGTDGSNDIYRHKDTPLLEPRHEPGLHTIRRTFSRFSRPFGTKKRPLKEPSEEELPLKYKGGAKRAKIANPEHKNGKLRSKPTSDRLSDDDDGGGNGSSSGSGTEGGYAGSASSNDNVVQVGSCSSPSVSSSEDSMKKKRRIHDARGNSASTSDPARAMLSKKHESSLSMSSEIADFSSSNCDGDGTQTFSAAFRQTESPSITSSSEEDDLGHKFKHRQSIEKISCPRWSSVSREQQSDDSSDADYRKPRARTKSKVRSLQGRTPILSVGCDIMAHILTFLEPPNILEVLTMPLSKDWLNTFTRQPELWRVLCLLDPFKAQVEHDDGNESTDDSIDSYSMNVESELKRTFGKFRLLYTSFVRCMRYLSRIKDDAVHGRAPSMIDYGARQTNGHNISANHSLHQFLARARGVAIPRQADSDTSDEDNNASGLVARAGHLDKHVGVSDDGSATSTKRKQDEVKVEKKKQKRKVKYGYSQLTGRLLGPSADGVPGLDVELPWSCAIYSIVNWMAAFSDVEGIQTMCLKVLPFLLEDEQQRITAQRAGLTDVVLRGMVMFPNSTSLHTAAFHTLVLLARPLGGREGMLFHTSMVNSSGIFGAESGSSGNRRSGIAVMLDSMKRFQNNEVLQAMACWSLVNIALAPAQKEVLVKLGGIERTTSAMMEHPYSAEVQFRALFALINLVIPSVNLSANPEGRGDEVIQAVPVEDTTEKEVLDENVEQVVSLVVTAMKNFCASEAILNRACLVLHNLSLTQDYHRALLWTPNCYQMLEWCLANYLNDQVLQQSAAGTLHRLQITLSSDDALRSRFVNSLQSQQQLSLEQAHREAMILHEQQQTHNRHHQDGDASNMETIH